MGGLKEKTRFEVESEALGGGMASYLAHHQPPQPTTKERDCRREKKWSRHHLVAVECVDLRYDTHFKSSSELPGGRNQPDDDEGGDSWDATPSDEAPKQ